MIAKMRNMGEACTSANRFYVHEQVHGEFTKKLAAKMAALKSATGSMTGLRWDLSSMPTPGRRSSSSVADAVGKGAKVLTGGKPAAVRDIFIPRRSSSGSGGRQHAARGDFRAGCRDPDFRSEDEVVKRANDTEYGLVAYLYTKDLSRGMRVSEQLDFGMIGLNRGLVSDPAAPFGGMKQSGIGREGAHEGMMEFMEAQYISVAW